MLLFWIPAVIMFVCLIVMCEDNFNLSSIILWILWFIYVFVLIFSSVHTWEKYAKPICSHEFEITAMSDNHEMYIVPRTWSCEGDTEVRYYFMRPYNGGLKEEYVEASRSIIYQTDDVTPHIECYWTKRIDEKEHPFLSFWFMQDDWNSTDDDKKEYHIYIPKGSVVDTYNIDLE